MNSLIGILATFFIAVFTVGCGQGRASSPIKPTESAIDEGAAKVEDLDQEEVGALPTDSQNQNTPETPTMEAGEESNNQDIISESQQIAELQSQMRLPQKWYSTFLFLVCQDA